MEIQEITETKNALLGEGYTLHVFRNFRENMNNISHYNTDIDLLDKARIQRQTC